MPKACFAEEKGMKTLIGLLMATTLTLAMTPAMAKPLVSRPAAIEKPCLEQGDANRCFELGYKFMHEKGKNSKKLARYYFQVGCQAKLQKSTCNPDEAKLAARDFTQSRVIASKPGPVKATPAGK